MMVPRMSIVLDLIVLSMIVYPGFPAVAADRPAARGKVYLVGMGPGDADLVTFKAAQVLKDADSVFCFRYLKDEVARYAPPAKISVASPLLMARVCGRKPAKLAAGNAPRKWKRATKNSRQFAAKVRSLVAAGKTVVFADAGDPTVYCPWSWVTEEFADLQPVVVPGLSSFNAANAALKQSITRIAARCSSRPARTWARLTKMGV